MNSNLHNLISSHSKTNDTHVRRFERFLKNNKLDNALVVTESGDVVDLYSLAELSRHIGSRHIGVTASIWKQVCCKLSNGFRCIGRLLFKSSNLGFKLSAKMAICWMQLCCKLSNSAHCIERLLYKVGNIEI